MTLDDWDEKMGKHLQLIEQGADIAARHARLLAGKPEFMTLAEGELIVVRSVLESALAKVIEAQRVYEAKEVVT